MDPERTPCKKTQVAPSGSKETFPGHPDPDRFSAINAPLRTTQHSMGSRMRDKAAPQTLNAAKEEFENNLSAQKPNACRKILFKFSRIQVWQEVDKACGRL